MKVGIMQPYFWPYLGYFQLISAVDVFVIYDNVEYTKKGWFNRNRFLCNGEAKYFTVPLRKDSDYLDVRDRYVAAEFDKVKLKRQIQAAYSRAPYFEDVFSLFCDCVDCECENLFEYIFYSVKKIVEYLDINTEIKISSTLEIGRESKGVDKVLAICKKVHATQYINPIGGLKLYDKQKFKEQGIELNFLQMNQIIYKQFSYPFCEALSILDVLMFNSRNEVKQLLKEYTLL